MTKTKKAKKNNRSGYFVMPKTDEERFWTNKLNAVIYVRVSSEGQVTHWNGLESQETACRERCEKQPWLEIEVVKVFREEWVSGKLMDRKAMNEATRYLEKENKKFTKIHYFVVTDADRIARPDDIAEAFTLEQSIEGLWVKIITVNNKRDTETDEGKFLQTIQYAIAWLERRKILRRTMNGRLNSLKKGRRPFTYPPLGYIRNRSGDWKYDDDIDEVKWPIIKEGLELYAHNPLFSKSQLYKFRVEKWLQTNHSRGNFYISYIEKIFRDYKLYFYAGFIYYPERGIDTPILWNQQALISLDTVEKIMGKETRKKTRANSPNLDKNLELHPLKGMITCEGCKRKVGCYASRGNGGVYYYYTCGNGYCEGRINIRKEVMESEFEQFIEKMKLPKEVFDTFKSYILKERAEKEKREANNIPQMQWHLLSIKAKMDKIEHKILSVSNENLIKKLEIEWATLETLKEDVEKKMNHKKNDKENLESILSQTEYLFTDPVGMWKKSNYEIRQLVFMVRFGGILYYKKNQWLRTNETTGLHYVFSLKWGDKFLFMAWGGTLSHQFFSEEEIEIFINILIMQSKYINAINYLLMKYKE